MILFYLGCTANVIIIDDTHYYCANAGDSRSVLCRGNGKMV
jgi:serine/threonine protein phosphatase PrpC